MNEHVDEAKQLRNNPVFIIVLACLVGIVLSSISFVLYYRSDTRKVVEQIQRNNIEFSSQVADGSELSVESLNKTESSIIDAVGAHKDDQEFPAAELSDSELGL